MMYDVDVFDVKFFFSFSFHGDVRCPCLVGVV